MNENRWRYFEYYRASKNAFEYFLLAQSLPSAKE